MNLQNCQLDLHQPFLPLLVNKGFACSWSHAAVTAMGSWPKAGWRAIRLQSLPQANGQEIVQNRDAKFSLSPFSAS